MRAILSLVIGIGFTAAAVAQVPQVIVNPITIIMPRIEVSKIELILELVSNPEAFALALSSLTPADRIAIAIEIQNKPEAFALMMESLAPSERIAVVIEIRNNTDAFILAMERITAAERLAVVIEIQKNPNQYAIELWKLNAKALKKFSVDLFLIDPAAWARVSEVFELPGYDPTARYVGGTGLDGARARLRAKRAKEGDSPEILKEADALMKRLKGAQ